MISWCGCWPSRPARRGLKLAGEGGLLAHLTKRVVESALEGELDDHLGYGTHDPGRALFAEGHRKCVA
jgi:transposase-like protein